MASMPGAVYSASVSAGSMLRRVGEVRSSREPTRSGAGAIAVKPICAAYSAVVCAPPART
eukprot:4235735-Prymnesium_polylepis.1